MTRSPDDRGYFGDYGGRFVPETLMAPLAELEKAFAKARRDRSFQNRFQRLLELTRLNERLSQAYILKEEFRAIYTMATSIRSARARMRRWCDTVLASGIAPLVRFAKGVLRDLKEITAYFRHRITSGRIEAFNNQIARLIHRACGMTNLRHLFLKMRAQSLKQI